VASAAASSAFTDIDTISKNQRDRFIGQ
jgi:hypothetical protein